MHAHDVVVVGAGPTGALLSLGMAQRGWDVVLLEAEHGVGDSPRAMAYFWHVLEGLDRLGVLDDLDNAGFRNDRFLQRVLSSGLQADISLGVIADEVPYAYNIHLGQHEVVRIALEHLAAHPNADMRFGSSVEGVEQDIGGAIVRLGDGGALRARWVVGADGARSTVRRSLGISFDGTTWPDRFVATNIRYPFGELGGLGNANMLLDPEHGCVVARIDESGLYRWTWGESSELPEETIMERLPERLLGLGFGDAEHEVVAYTPYRMHQRAADHMRRGNVLLVGDAAHATNPTGGLGLTCGMYDLLSLIEPLHSVLDGSADPTDLDAWGTERLRVFRDAASPTASMLKTKVYDEADLHAREAFVRMAADQSDPGATKARLLGARALGTGLPRHATELV
jgi:2-polyprenyl-6-methoxyphenol hydroxylase-like FAD-dependent oxidoreductase